MAVVPQGGHGQGLPASPSPSVEGHELRAMFDELDTDGSGELEKDEVSDTPQQLTAHSAPQRSSSRSLELFVWPLSRALACGLARLSNAARCCVSCCRSW